MSVDSSCATCLLVATIACSAGACYEGNAFSFFNLYLCNIADRWLRTSRRAKSSARSS